MNDKQTLQDIINTMSCDRFLEAVLDLSEKTVKWQKEYNKASDKLEKMSNRRQLKVTIETPEKIALSSFGAYEEDIESS